MKLKEYSMEQPVLFYAFLRQRVDNYSYKSLADLWLDFKKFFALLQQYIADVLISKVLISQLCLDLAGFSGQIFVLSCVIITSCFTSG